MLNFQLKKFVKVPEPKELSFCHKLKSSDPNIFATFDILKLDYFSYKY